MGCSGRVAMPCDCGMEERAVRVMERARIPKRYEHCDFESYVTDLADGKTWTAGTFAVVEAGQNAGAGICAGLSGFGGKRIVVDGAFWGGKTHLAVASLKELIRRGHAGLFCDYRELLKEIQASYNPASESTEMVILEPVRTAEVLVMDDLGASKPSAWVLDIIGLVLNARYNERRVTILTTNYFDEVPSVEPAPRIAGWATRGDTGRFAWGSDRGTHEVPALRDVPDRGGVGSGFSARGAVGGSRPRLIKPFYRPTYGTDLDFRTSRRQFACGNARSSFQSECPRARSQQRIHASSGVLLQETCSGYRSGPANPTFLGNPALVRTVADVPCWKKQSGWKNQSAKKCKGAPAKPSSEQKPESSTLNSRAGMVVTAHG